LRSGGLMRALFFAYLVLVIAGLVYMTAIGFIHN
jgi:hypothetical protein